MTHNKQDAYDFFPWFLEDLETFKEHNSQTTSLIEFVKR